MNKALVSIGVLCGVTAVAGAVLGRVPEQALADATTPVQVQIKSSCAMSSVTNTNEEHVATIDPGAYKTDIGKTTLTVACNDSNGWAIYAVGYGEDSKGETRLKAIGEDGNPYYIATGTATSGGTSNWAMKLMAGQGTVTSAIVTAYQSYHAVPSAYDKVAALASNTSPAGEKVQTTYAVYVASGQMAGTYNGKVKYTLLHPSSETPCAGSGCVVNFNANSGTAGSLTSATQEADRYFDLDDYFETAGTLPTRSGYNFKGFAKTNNATQPNYAYDERNGLFYPSVHYVSGSSAETLYAVWEKQIVTFDQAFANAGKSKATAKDGKQYYRMQDMTTSICSAVTAASSTAAADTQIGTLVDDRGDKKTYTVAKLLDGNCWMTENLRLGGSSAITLTSSDSEVSSNFTLPAHVSSWTSTYTDAMIHVSDDVDTVTNQYYGYYYNYYAASAGTVTNSGTVNASASICPKGWTLPDNYTQTVGKSYSNLLCQYGIINNITDNSDYATTDGYAKLISAPLSFALSGFHYSSGTTVDNRGSFGYYLSGTSSSTNSAYYLSFNSSYVGPRNGGNKRYGYAIRCVAQ